MLDEFQISAIGHVRSPFREKFAIPRQPRLVSSIPGTIVLAPPHNRAESIRGLDQFSHIWVVFRFHAIAAEPASSSVRPPRLGGNARMGVFASRATHRPNRIGLSAVRLSGIEVNREAVLIHISDHDLLDGTPVLDIKPYVAYTDSIADAVSGFAQTPPPQPLQVDWTDIALAQCPVASAASGLDFMHLVTNLLSADPRPAYRSGSPDAHRYGFRLDRYDVRFEIEAQTARVLEIARVE